MRNKRYYSVRTGRNPLAKSFDLVAFRNLFKSFYVDMEGKGYFQEAFGYECVDNGSVAGTLGSDLAGVALRKLRKEKLLPVLDHVATYSEDDLFDVIEFLFDHCSQPLEKDGYYHNFNDCGWHYKLFKREPGRQHYRRELNELLALYGGGYELSGDGEILSLPDKGFENFIDTALPALDPENVEKRVAVACLKFRHRSTLNDRKDAIRDLADVLEYLKPRAQPVLESADESDLFQLANKFGIRHHNSNQKTTYDKAIWYSWMFYYYLATIHAVVRLIEKAEKAGGKSG
jgi:hypothetical protein